MENSDVSTPPSRLRLHTLMPANEPEKLVRSILDAYRAAVHARDVDAFVALYDEQVCVFDLWEHWSYQGVEAWRGMVAGWFGSLGIERVAVDFDDVHTTVAQDMAFAHAFVRYRGLSAGGEELRAMQNRLTWVLRQKNGVWKIVHEHTSAPVDSGTLKANLRR